MFKAQVRRIDQGLKQIHAAVRAVTENPGTLRVGIVGERASVKHEGSSLTNAEIATVHEFGSNDGHVPARPFLHNTMAEHRDEYLDRLSKLVHTAVLRGKLDYRHALGLIGEKAAADVKRKITTGDPAWPPLAESTVNRKGIDKPLIDTGALRASVSYVVDPGKAEP